MPLAMLPRTIVFESNDLTKATDVQKIIEDLRAKVDALIEQNERIIKMMRAPPPG